MSLIGAMFEGTSHLGDVFCLQDEGNAGAAAVEDLTIFYTATGFSPASYLPAYNALLVEKSALENESPWTTLTSGGATAYWCKWKDLGGRARALTEQIGAALGIAPPPNPVKPGLADQILGQLKAVVVVGGGLYVVGRFLGRDKR